MKTTRVVLFYCFLVAPVGAQLGCGNANQPNSTAPMKSGTNDARKAPSNHRDTTSEEHDAEEESDLLTTGNSDDAISSLRNAIRKHPRNTRLLIQLGKAYAAQGDEDSAIKSFLRALAIDSAKTEANAQLAKLLHRQGNCLEAIPHYRAAIDDDPNNASLHEGLGLALSVVGDTEAALASFRRATELQPNLYVALNEIAWLISTHPEHLHEQGEEALSCAKSAAELTHYREPAILGTLAAAYAKLERFEEATETVEKALVLARNAESGSLVVELQQQLHHYQRRQPWHLPSQQRTAIQLAKERETLDDTVFADEKLAQHYEKTIVQLWDSLLSQDDKFAPLLNVQFDSLIVGSRGIAEDLHSGVPGVLRSHSEEPLHTLSRSQFAARLKSLKDAGWLIEQTEWHHAGFQPATNKRAAKSEVAVTIHASNTQTKERVILSAELQVTWSAEHDALGNPLPQLVDGSKFQILSRKGEPILKRLLVVDPRRAAPNTRPRVLPLIVRDLNGDGLSEIVLAGCNLIYWNEGGGSLKKDRFLAHPKRLAPTGVIEDFDGDGIDDFLGFHELRLNIWRGAADGRFPHAPTIGWDRLFDAPQAVTTGDFDGDGDLDLFVGQYKAPYRSGQMPSPYYDANDGYPAYLLRNDSSPQDGVVFVDVTQSRGLEKKRHRRTYSASFVDLDNDSDQDLLVVSDFAGLDVYENDGQGNFRDITEVVTDEAHCFGMSHTVDDFNNDGQVDFYMTGMGSTTARRLEQLGAARPGFDRHTKMRMPMGYGNRMYLRKDARFVEPAFKDQVARTGWSWGCASADYDNDGDSDLYIANGHVSGKSTQDYCTQFWCHDVYSAASNDDDAFQQLFAKQLGSTQRYETSWNGYEHNALFLNCDRDEYVNVSYLLGASLEEDCRAVVSDDIDGDGSQDLLVTSHHEADGATRHVLYILKNHLAPRRNWIGVRLQGARSVGSQITLHTQGGKRVAHVVAGDSFCCQGPAAAHFGLGDLTAVEKIEIRWPNSLRTTIQTPKINQYHLVKQSDQ